MKNLSTNLIITIIVDILTSFYEDLLVCEYDYKLIIKCVFLLYLFWTIGPVFFISVSKCGPFHAIESNYRKCIVNLETKMLCELFTRTFL